MTVNDVAGLIEAHAPIRFQESYDNSGLSVGDPSMDVTGVLICFDVTEQVVDEAISLGANLIVSHHPVIFSGLKSITGKSAVERIVLKAIQHSIALYAAHTNLDSVYSGINDVLCQKLKLSSCRILSPLKGQLSKLITFVPTAHLGNVRAALFEAGAGHIGSYDSCSYASSGEGSFRANKGANPFVGTVGEMHFEQEVRLEVICPKAALPYAIQRLRESHPYEEPAFDIVSLENELERVGIGMIGSLEMPMSEDDFVQHVRSALGCEVVRSSKNRGKTIKTVAVCGGSGGSLASLAAAKRADAYVTGDLKYHTFLDYGERLLLVDAGHFETEHFAIDIFYDFITEKKANFAVYKTKLVENPVNYLYR